MFSILGVSFCGRRQTTWAGPEQLWSLPLTAGCKSLSNAPGSFLWPNLSSLPSIPSQSSPFLLPISHLHILAHRHFRQEVCLRPRRKENEKSTRKQEKTSRIKKTRRVRRQDGGERQGDCGQDRLRCHRTGMLSITPMRCGGGQIQVLQRVRMHVVYVYRYQINVQCHLICTHDTHARAHARQHPPGTSPYACARASAGGVGGVGGCGGA